MEKILTAILLCCFSFSAFGQEIHIQKNVNMMAFSKKPSSNMYAVSDIMPIGWSKDGKFAFVHKRSVAGRGGVIYSYIIINSVNDGIIWIYEDDWPNSDTVRVGKSIQKNQSIVVEQLKKYEIVQGQGTDLYDFPLLRDGAVYKPELKVRKKPEKHPFLGDIESLAVYMLRDDIKRKRIFYKDNPGAFSYWIAGYFLSPFEQRILVAIGEEKWGFEGTEGDFLFSGCSLTRQR